MNTQITRGKIKIVFLIYWFDFKDFILLIISCSTKHSETKHSGKKT